MTRLVTYFDPQPSGSELPARMPSPFDQDGPHPLARGAAEQLRAQLRRGQPVSADQFEGQHRGKMFGVLVVADGDGRVGYLRGFSGMVDGSWHLDGFVGPLFDAGQRDTFWPAGEAELIALDEQLEAVAREAATARAALVELQEKRTLRAEYRAQREPLARAVSTLEQARLALKRRQAARSCELLEQLYAGYQIDSARGERRALRSLFAPATPPGGSGDCAAPKLFGHALREGLRPLALAEFWVGTPPAAGGRQEGIYYPSCRGKCGPVLAHMLDGLDVDPAPVFGDGRIAADEPRTIFEDRWLVVVDKPIGLLSVPGRGGRLRDSVLTRLQARHPDATGPLLVHRLDLDTSGLLLAAKDPATHTALQRQFSRREIEKQYVAWVDGAVAGEGGTIDLALRVDVDDRPRQIHDPRHGKTAVTDWRVLSRAGTRTRVALFPRTGRTHQLRVHAAHPRGLGAPIVGDRLYGRPDERLMLHAELLRFTHPHTGQSLELRRPAPF